MKSKHLSTSLSTQTSAAAKQ